MNTTASDSALSTTQPVITAAGAKEVLAAAEAKAFEMGVPVAISVVDAAGALKAFLAMDGVPPVALGWATDKAITAASFRAPTHTLADGLAEAPATLASVMAQPHATVAPAGFPLLVDGVVVGAVGASGGTPEQDRAVAETGVEALA